MRTKLTILIIFVVLLLIAADVLYFNWRNISGRYLLPEYPGLKRLGASFDFPRVFYASWETEDTILFLAVDSGPGGYFYQYSLKDNQLKMVFSGYRAFIFQLSPDKKWIAFSAWPDDHLHRQLWIAEINGNPTVIASNSLGPYDLGLLGWSYDGKSVLFDYRCNPKTSCISIVNKDTQNIKKVYQIDKDEEAITPYTSINFDQVMYVRNKDEYAITTLNISEKNLKRQSYESTMGEVKRISSKNWLVGASGGQLFFTPYDNKCIKEPFKELVGIENVDVLETNHGIFMLLQDRYGSLYTMNLEESLQTQSIDQFFTCS